MAKFKRPLGKPMKKQLAKFKRPIYLYSCTSINVITERNSPQQLQRMKENKPTQQTRANAIKTQWSVDERFQCKICFENHVEVIFLPCKHVCCCQKCYNKLRVQECPICRAKIKGVQPLYFA